MTPEKIEELRALAGRLSGTAYNENLAAILGAALEHIHMQEEQLANARAAKNLHARREAKLLSQVAALQEIAEEERGRALWFVGDDPEHPENLEWAAEPNLIPESVRRLWINAARRQLAEEHPEVDWK